MGVVSKAVSFFSGCGNHILKKNDTAQLWYTKYIN